MPYDVLQRMLANLQASHKVYQRLLSLARLKQAHIMNNELESLREDLKLEEQLAGRGADLNAEREEIHSKCRTVLNLGPDAETLEDLCDGMPPEWNYRFASIRKEMRSTLEELHRVNRMNALLVNNCLEFMEGLLAALFDAEPTAAYGPRGNSRRIAELPLRTLDAQA